MFFLDTHSVIILFDSGATHNFISGSYALGHGLPIESTKIPYVIKTPGSEIVATQLLRDAPLMLAGEAYWTTLILLENQGIDVILGIGWMTLHGALINIPSRTICLNSPTQGQLC